MPVVMAGGRRAASSAGDEVRCLAPVDIGARLRGRWPLQGLLSGWRLAADSREETGLRLF